MVGFCHGGDLLGNHDGYLVMQVILWWKLSTDESYLVMKVMIVKEVMTGDVSPLANLLLHLGPIEKI